MIINMFSISYFIYLIICALICVGFYFLFRNKSKKTQYIAILTPMVISLVIHFLKLLTPVYRNELPYSIISITPETICAISTLAFPFIFLSKSKILKDYMVVVGVVSGFLTLIIPGEALGFHPLDIEALRFYFAHLVIFMCPLFTYIFKFHKLEKGWIKHTLLLLLLVIIIMMCDNILFTFILKGHDAGMAYLEELGLLE